MNIKELHGLPIKKVIALLQLENPEDSIYSFSSTLMILNKNGEHKGSIYLKETTQLLNREISGRMEELARRIVMGGPLLRYRGRANE